MKIFVICENLFCFFIFNRVTEGKYDDRDWKGVNDDIIQWGLFAVGTNIMAGISTIS